MNTHTTCHHAPHAPIGMFDSGVGGLSVYLHLKSLLPHEEILYYADTKNVPYGEKSSEEIIALTDAAVAWLIKKGAKLVVIACNSASAYALDVLRAKYTLPIVGLVPAIKPACLASQNKKIAVLATRATLNGALFSEVVNHVATPLGVTVYRHFEPKLVPWVEMGMPIDHQVADLLITQMHTWAKDGVDALVLGCTHYPFFRAFLEAEITEKAINMTLIDSGAAIASRVQSLLKDRTAPPTDQPNPLRFFATGDDATVSHTLSIAERLIGEKVLPMTATHNEIFS
ncbi:MAG: glutamate racemase [Moraxella sp.]|nr:glutamate racemase [Moraxella sp.]